MSSVAAQKKRLWHLLENFSDGVLVKCGEDGGELALPVYIAELDQPYRLILVQSDSTLAAARLDEAAVLLTFQSDDCTLWLKGSCTTDRSREEIERLWDDRWRDIISSGPSDPSLYLLVVDAAEGEYWDRRTASGLEQALECARSLLIGPAEEPTPPHGRVKLASCKADRAAVEVSGEIETVSGGLQLLPPALCEAKRADGASVGPEPSKRAMVN